MLPKALLFHRHQILFILHLPNSLPSKMTLKTMKTTKIVWVVRSKRSTLPAPFSFVTWQTTQILWHCKQNLSSLALFVPFTPTVNIAASS